jgi:cephalosporin hydroxylase
MVSLDADHHSHHVQAEIYFWSHFVSPGCYLVVEDACFDAFAAAGHADWARVGGSQIPEVGGPLDAMVKRGLFADSRFWRDTELEGRTSISHSPCGWWRKHE